MVYDVFSYYEIEVNLLNLQNIDIHISVGDISNNDNYLKV